MSDTNYIRTQSLELLLKLDSQAGACVPSPEQNPFFRSKGESILGTFAFAGCVLVHIFQERIPPVGKQKQSSAYIV